ncbi:hypothetical protein H1R16_11260 [Marnyiella aurantia]|uniref:Uncharacterized protein n=1 Tax=Marnyiella aurantia TaxID=2758037 RepID=A0A7D7QF19_9FLAO|nr:hypothetical protein [Marnyiella aurantia]MBA5246367.1 hypothetical protein [Marnyiella aurantia]MBP0612820.1 hypothetical protein [Marnyiella aurantia]QMS98263.1 hypothetical protein H1R16_11260 [Marnyiella aurantia]
MQLYYKIFLILFAIFIAFNLYAVDWRIGLMNEENLKYVFSLSAGIVGLLLVFVLHTWSKLKSRP